MFEQDQKLLELEAFRKLTRVIDADYQTLLQRVEKFNKQTELTV